MALVAPWVRKKYIPAYAVMIFTWGAPTSVVELSLEGRLSSRSYQGQDGQMRFVNEINLTDVQFLGRGGDGGGAADSAPYEAGVGAMADEGRVDNDPVDDLPF